MILSVRRSALILLAAFLVFAAAVVARLAMGRPPLADTPVGGRSAAAPVPFTTADWVIALQSHLRNDPGDADAYAQLGLALLQRVRETADVALYARAEMAFTEALRRNGRHLDALIGQGMLALARHRFAEALQWGEQAQALAPQKAQIYGIIGDAYLELGRYDEAETAYQRMINLRPDLNSYSRISYFRELFGDTGGAIEAMQQAVGAGIPTAEATLWAKVQLGHLYFNQGNFVQAETIYRQVLATKPDYVYAFAATARVRAAQGHYDEAIGYYERIVQVLPLAEFVIALGDLYTVTGQREKAQDQYNLVRAIQQLQASAGVDVDLELALFEADHGDAARALGMAQAAYQRRPTIYGADTLAWALYRHGDYADAWRYSREALRLGTKDALLHYHAGMIAHALGDSDAARKHLRQALDINPAFSFIHAPTAREVLEALSP